ncbi:MAG: bifunctional 4-hydroxy-3-methylbut-2-enyl diphosphate reductase/30S ribosomal protein S1 [Lachnospiraceae bacterium]|nr:bifunctional 4-hydroxy-3-methylbut-2-enyl diphosphate reductase/30S ribosomal protein S1 [Lachnospiraceae bacterium]MDE6626774.1 bifunctional 4-hydroxy-3-methylbut-2-enyl diphosphate reductase/30S ribosomal protein S1 [Lachnospiraceae bacterium]
MEIILAKTAGFCFGVKRAVDTVYEQVDKGNVYTYGPIIHNEEVVKDLEAKGVRIIESEQELKELKQGTVVIRSHGVERKIYEVIKEKALDLVDATCPFVKKIHKIVDKDSAEGKQIIIIGNRNHPEVMGIVGWCNQPPIVLESVEEAQNLTISPEKEISLVSQTTFNHKKFNKVVEIFKQKGYNITVYNTICNATEERQKETASIARQVDAMVVIGGKNSSNTQKLYDISKKECANTYYIQTLVDLDLAAFESVGRVGITAGASTPNQIIKEVHGSMAEDFGKMFEESLAEESRISPGKIVKGTVIDVKEDEIILNINYKADGIITKNEYSNDVNISLKDKVQIGENIEAKVIKTNDGDGQVLLSVKRVAAEKANEQLEDAFNNEEILKGIVTQVLDGGLSVNVGEARVFIPASLVSDTFERDLTKYKDQEIEFKITEFNPRKRRIIGNRKMLIEAEKKAAKEALFARINVGDTVEGTVKNVTDFGAFIDLGGADGLLHISEMSWGRVDNPKKIFKVGDSVKALIKDIQGEKIALSLKFEDTNPWLTAADKYAVGSIITGRVARMTDFGAFVELEPGVDALLHVSQIAREHIDKPSSVLSVGQEIEAKVVDFRLDEKKISLSMKVLLSDEDDTEEEVVEDVPEEMTENTVEDTVAEEVPETEETSEASEETVE